GSNPPGTPGFSRPYTALTPERRLGKNMKSPRSESTLRGLSSFRGSGRELLRSLPLRALRHGRAWGLPGKVGAIHRGSAVGGLHSFPDVDRVGFQARMRSWASRYDRREHVPKPR